MEVHICVSTSSDKSRRRRDFFSVISLEILIFLVMFVSEIMISARNDRINRLVSQFPFTCLASQFSIYSSTVSIFHFSSTVSNFHFSSTVSNFHLLIQRFKFPKRLKFPFTHLPVASQISIYSSVSNLRR